MRINIEKRTTKAGDKQGIRLVYYFGSKINDAGKLVHNRKSKYLDLYLFNNPKTKAEEQHNTETMQLVEQIKAKQLAEYAKGQFKLIPAPIVFHETAQPKTVKLTLNFDIDQLSKELAKHGYQVIEAGK